MSWWQFDDSDGTLATAFASVIGYSVGTVVGVLTEKVDRRRREWKEAGNDGC